MKGCRLQNFQVMSVRHATRGNHKRQQQGMLLLEDAGQWRKVAIEHSVLAGCSCCLESDCMQKNEETAGFGAHSTQACARIKESVVDPFLLCSAVRATFPSMRRKELVCEQTCQEQDSSQLLQVRCIFTASWSPSQQVSLLVGSQNFLPAKNQCF